MCSTVIPARRFGLVVCLCLCLCRCSSGVAGELSGRIVDETGQPIAGARIHLFKRAVPDESERLISTSSAAAGDFHFKELPKATYRLYAHAEGWSTDGRMVREQDLIDGPLEGIDITLTRPRFLQIDVQDQMGEPVSGARPHHLFWHGPNGPVWIPSWFARELGINFRPSGSNGRLVIDGVPNNATARVVVEHDEMVRSRLLDLQGNDVRRAVLKRGVPVTLEFSSEDGVLPRAVEAWFEYEGNGFADLIWERLRLDEHGRVTFCAIPGRYVLRLQHSKQQMYPVELESIELKADTPLRIEFDARPKGIVKGRVVNALTGEPVPDSFVRGLLRNPSTTSDEFGVGPGWTWGSYAVKTDAHGRYEMQLGIGSARIIPRMRRFAGESPYVEVEVSKQGTTAIDMRVTPMPTIRGQVFDIDGRPAAGAIVQPRPQDDQFDLPIECDIHGRFQYTIAMTSEAKKPVRGSSIELHVFDPHQRFEAHASVNIEPARSEYDVQLNLKAANPTLPETNAQLDIVPARMDLNWSPAPEMECVEWLHVRGKPPSMVSLRRKWVLLDFWTTWCGPCKVDQPKLELLNKLYRDRGLTIIGIHDNTVPKEAVRKHVSKNGPRFPIGIDVPTGETVERYRVTGYPTYILIDPDGIIVDAGSPQLRHGTFETVRYHLFNRGAGKRGPS